MFGRTLLISLQATYNTLSVRIGEELGLVRKVVDHPVADDANDHCCKSLEDEDPRPAWFAADAVHKRDSGGEEATEGACKCCSAEEDCGADAEFVAFVPGAEVVVDTLSKVSQASPTSAWVLDSQETVQLLRLQGRSEPLLDQRSCSQDLRSGLVKGHRLFKAHCQLLVGTLTHTDHDDTPKHHDKRNENARPQPLQQDIREGLESSVGDEEERESRAVFPIGHIQVFEETIDLCVPDVGAIWG